MLRRAGGFAVLVTVAASAAAFSASPATADPTCSELGIAVHAQHIIGDYVTGLGTLLSPDPQFTNWPPEPGQVGEAVKANNGAATPGGPGPGFHFEHGFAPGASFCVEQAHPNGFTAPPAPGPPSP